MARKTVKVNVPGDIDALVLLFEKIVLRNDGILPTVPQSTIYLTLGALVGIQVSVSSSGSTGTPSPPPPGTKKLPEAEIGLPMRVLYPSLKRNYLDYIALKSLLQTTSNALQTQLGLSAGQTVGSVSTARNFISRASKVLQGMFSGGESELETYGFSVTVGTAAGPTPTPAPTK